uniref:tetraacyldisaccharide 4'-kinase n=1 Tax=Desulfococcus sp. TaxID=2025834 RepID=UPI0035937661
MKRLRSRIHAVIRDPRPKAGGALGWALSAVARGYGKLMAERARWYETGRLPSRRLPCGVVSVGNITVGGTGKTPMALRLAREFACAGRRTVIVSRGYRGRAEAEGGIVSDGGSLFMTADAAGDEPFMMAESLIAAGLDVPVVVGRNRHAAGMTAVFRFAPEVVILDDAFQHLRLRRDLNLLLLDGTAPFGNGRVLPRGPLREPLSALARADAVILTRCPPG